MTPFEAGQQLGELAFGSPENARGARSPGLIGMLTGASQAPGAIYQQTLSRGAQAANAMQEARLNRTKALIAEQTRAARDRYLTDYQGAGLGDQAQLAADAALGATTSNPNQLVGVVPQMRAIIAANAGDDPALNRDVAAFKGTPLALATTNGGITTTNPYTAPEVAANPVGLGDIAAKQAAATASRAAAGASGARAALYGTQNRALLHPDQVPGASFNKPSKSGGSPQDKQTIEGFRQRIAAGKATPEQVAAFLTKQGRPDLAKQIFNPSYVVGDGE